jgi:hypothetical protein
VKTKSFESNFLAAKAKTAVTIMNATGWNERIVNPAEVGVDSIFFYVFDYQTQGIWCCSIPKAAFHAVVKQSESVNQADAIAYCGHLIAQWAEGNALSPDKEEHLAIALTSYIRITRTFQLTDRATTQNHFVVIRYGKTDTLRPYAVSGPPRHLIDAGTIKASMYKVITMDSQSHPEWIA